MHKIIINPRELPPNMQGAARKYFLLAIVGQFVCNAETAVKHQYGGDYYAIHNTRDVVLVEEKYHNKVDVRKATVKRCEQTLLL